MISMNNIQFLHPLPLFSICPNGSELGKTRSRPWTLKLRLPTTPFPTPIPFGILAGCRLYLADVSITYNARATHNSLQLKIDLNLIQYSAAKLKQTRLTLNAKNKTKMLSKAEPGTCL